MFRKNWIESRIYMNAILNSRLFQTFKHKKASTDARFSFFR
ncbi:hypothetical protein N646_4455 [Vibrio alginolyticus NBRC 15630 = ATCC 17749]|uniref:Uncharacterized protein n=1 Tax=Vibrio alginolyticus (strain ATCC 17749 / DSM 2171 / NBRC 15630 / NCIMB 1903 / NCTC 12160 / XII-53) TaxID=1219076 RepID=A0A2I3CRK3_VIBAX|nr:hypothetical protein N646_4455 [Vibrio alginolyticus NBRC 15630 = ATCC 17749]